MGKSVTLFYSAGDIFFVTSLSLFSGSNASYLSLGEEISGVGDGGGGAEKGQNRVNNITRSTL